MWLPGCGDHWGPFRRLDARKIDTHIRGQGWDWKIEIK